VLGTHDKNLGREELVSLIKESGNEIAVHGYRHLSLACTDIGAAAYDVIKDREVLETLFGRVVKGMAYANGSFNSEVLDMIRCCGIEYSRTTISTEGFKLPEDWLRLNPTCHHKNPRLMELAESFVANDDEQVYFRKKGVKMFYVWGHSYEFDRDGNWELFEQLCSFVGGRDDVWYATNGEIYDYVEAYRRLRFSHDGKIIHNPSATDICAYDGKAGEIIIRSGETLNLND